MNEKADNAGGAGTDTSSMSLDELRASLGSALARITALEQRWAQWDRAFEWYNDQRREKGFE